MDNKDRPLRVPVARVLGAALVNELKRVTVIGETADGKLFAASSHPTKTVLKDLARFDRYLEGDESELADPITVYI